MSRTKYTTGVALAIAVALVGVGLGAAAAGVPADGGTVFQANGTNGANATDGGNATDAMNATDGGNATNGANVTDSGNETDGANATDGESATDALPPGVSQDGVTNASALADAHAAALSETAYTFTFSQSASFSFGNVTAEVGNESVAVNNITDGGNATDAANVTADAAAAAAGVGNASENQTNATAMADNRTADEQPPQMGAGDSVSGQSAMAAPSSGLFPDSGIGALGSTAFNSTENGTVAAGLFPSSVVTEATIQLDGEPQTVTSEQWATDRVLLVQTTSANQLIYQRVDLTANDTESLLTFTREDYERTVTKADIVEQTLEMGDFELAGTEQTDNGTLYTLEASSLAEDAMVGSDAAAFNATVVVDRDGLVRELSLTLDSEGMSMDYDLTVTPQESVEVTQPDWTRVLLE
jgi:hypothetical protein